MLKFYLFIFTSLFIMCSCASSNNEQQPEEQRTYSNLVKLEEPQKASQKPGKVYIDSVTKITKNSKKVLLISGNFADGCTHLKSVNHRIQHDSLSFQISTWRDAKAMCTQALTPFSFIYDKLSMKELSTHSQATIKGKTYSF